ncbi:rodlin [Actinomadura sp. 6N118]|uniref:rodlin n=1 Tax=Actinomadura sp. 6N118 TaxID=3375151 RepID=UPI0037BB05FB
MNLPIRLAALTFTAGTAVVSLSLPAAAAHTESAAVPGDKPCIGLPVKANIGSLVGLINIAVQDIPILSAPNNQVCANTGTPVDEPVSHILSDIPVLPGNGAGNG